MTIELEFSGEVSLWCKKHNQQLEGSAQRSHYAVWEIEVETCSDCLDEIREVDRGN